MTNTLTIPATPALIPASVAGFYDPSEFDTLGGAVRVLADVLVSPLGIPALVAAQAEVARLARLATTEWLAQPATVYHDEYEVGADDLRCGVCELEVGHDGDPGERDTRFVEFAKNGDDIVCSGCLWVARG